MTCWDVLHARFATKRINHSLTFSDGDACTNQAESYFSRLRRAEISTHHHISGRYLNAYAQEMACREDHRRMPNGTLYLLAAGGWRCPWASSFKGLEGLLAARAELICTTCCSLPQYIDEMDNAA